MSQGLDIDIMMNSSTMLRFHDFSDAEDLEILGEMEKPTMAQIGVNYDRKGRSGTSAIINFSRQNPKASENLQEDLIGEVIDIDNTPVFRNISDCSPFLLDWGVGEDYATRKFRMSKPFPGHYTKLQPTGAPRREETQAAGAASQSQGRAELKVEEWRRSRRSSVEETQAQRLPAGK
ncbi:unnamed protein product [Fraxinus pennsylvanica]|uniref:Uncharacterized protein n=1 Tax=Fraxinus pennsylvanica TaxID=56036 RepID=A0AAD1Z3Y0_9LAMI|nr:unnamed protein product [Fraxinus pennsylvanica]